MSSSLKRLIWLSCLPGCSGSLAIGKELAGDHIRERNGKNSQLVRLVFGKLIHFLFAKHSSTHCVDGSGFLYLPVNYINICRVSPDSSSSAEKKAKKMNGINT